jgi:hypothetical protein
MDAISYCDKNNCSYDEIIKTKKLAKGGKIGTSDIKDISVGGLRRDYGGGYGVFVVLKDGTKHHIRGNNNDLSKVKNAPVQHRGIEKTMTLREYAIDKINNGYDPVKKTMAKGGSIESDIKKLEAVIKNDMISAEHKAKAKVLLAEKKAELEVDKVASTVKKAPSKPKYKTVKAPSNKKDITITKPQIVAYITKNSKLSPKKFFDQMVKFLHLEVFGRKSSSSMKDLVALPSGNSPLGKWDMLSYIQTRASGHNQSSEFTYEAFKKEMENMMARESKAENPKAKTVKSPFPKKKFAIGDKVTAPVTKGQVAIVREIVISKNNSWVYTIEWNGHSYEAGWQALTLVKAPSNKEVSSSEINEFAKYVSEFYGKKGLYAKDYNGGFTSSQIEKAIKKYVSDPKTKWGGGDSMDRELMRDKYLIPLFPKKAKSVKAPAKAKAKTVKKPTKTVKSPAPLSKTHKKTDGRSLIADIAKKIRREDETYMQARGRAAKIWRGEMDMPTGVTVKRSLVQNGKSNKKSDKKRKALHAGKRVSKSGRVYYESRKNRSDEDRRKKL